MTNRTYFLAEDLSQANQIVEALREHGVGNDQIGVISKQQNIELTELPEANLAEKSDVVSALQRGAATGATTGLLAGLLAVAFPPSGLVIGGAALLGMTGAGAAVGAWSASLIGVSEQHPLLEQFESRIESGSLLIVADVDAQSAEQVAQQVGSGIGIPADHYGVFDDE